MGNRRMNRVRWRRRLGFSRVELIAVLCLAGVAAAVALPILSSGGRGVAADRAACLANLDRIGRALSDYLEASGDRWPSVAKLKTMDVHDPPWPTLPIVLAPFVEDPEVFHCPADSRLPPPNGPLARQYGTKTSYFETEGTSYEWQFADTYGGVKVGDDLMSRSEGFGLGRADQPLVRDFGLFHEGDDQGTFNTLYADLKARSSRGDRGRRRR